MTSQSSVVREAGSNPDSSPAAPPTSNNSVRASAGIKSPTRARAVRSSWALSENCGMKESLIGPVSLAEIAILSGFYPTSILITSDFLYNFIPNNFEGQLFSPGKPEQPAL